MALVNMNAGTMKGSARRPSQSKANLGLGGLAAVDFTSLETQTAPRKEYQPRTPGYEVFMDGLRALKEMEGIETKTMQQLGIIPAAPPPVPRGRNSRDPRVRAAAPAANRAKSYERAKSIDRREERRAREGVNTTRPTTGGADSSVVPMKRMREPETESRDPRLQRRGANVTDDEADSPSAPKRRLTFAEQIANADVAGRRGDKPRRRSLEDQGRGREGKQNLGDIWGRREY